MALALVEAGLLAPLAEEFIYRGVLLVSLMKEIGVGGAIFGSSLLFALAHAGAQPQSVLSLFLLGAALAYAAYRTRSLVAPILTHAVFNSVMVMGTFFGGG
jgi:membrane protease YdiL (CAAX protease family)